MLADFLDLIRTDILGSTPHFMGVTRIVRAFELQECCYDRILDFFQGSGLKLEKLTTVWTRTVLKIFPRVLRVNGRLLLVGDGIKIPKEGKKCLPLKAFIKCRHQTQNHLLLWVIHFKRSESWLVVY